MLFFPQPKFWSRLEASDTQIQVTHYSPIRAKTSQSPDQRTAAEHIKFEINNMTLLDKNNEQ